MFIIKGRNCVAKNIVTPAEQICLNVCVPRYITGYTGTPYLNNFNCTGVTGAGYTRAHKALQHKFIATLIFIF